jgi:hypothetical protein
LSTAEVDEICRRLEERIEPLQERLERHDRALFGDDGRGGMVSDVSKMASTVRVGVWLMAVIGTAVIASLVTMIFRGATLYVGGAVGG